MLRGQLGTDRKEGVLGGDSALHPMAGSSGAAVENIKHIVAAYGNFDIRNRWGSTPLAYATIRDNHLIAACLLDLGADINAVDVDGGSPLLAVLHLQCPIKRCSCC